jgi:AbrB family looped-hinge helix DNA binding protein
VRGVAERFVRVSQRGTVTLPARFRRALDLEAGDRLRVRIVDGSVRLSPITEGPIELYTDERIAEFLAAAEMTDEELAAADQAWGLKRDR